MRTTLFKIHSCLGLGSGLFVLLMSLSGSLLVFHEELDRLQYPPVSRLEGPVVSIDSAYRSVQHQYPRARISSCVLPDDDRLPFIFSLSEQGKPSLQVFVHPQTGQVIGTRNGGSDMRHNFMGWLSGFHNSFRLGKPGEWLLGFFGVLFILSLITGILLYRKHIVPAILFRTRSLHQTIGVYALLFNLLIAVSGVWMQRYVFKPRFYASQPAFKSVIQPSGPRSFSIDSSLRRVKKTYPAFTGYVIYFAGSSKGKTYVYGSNSTNSFIHSKKYADAVFFDSSGSLAGTAFIGSIPGSDRYDIINAQVHYGRYGGWLVKCLYAVFGLSGGLLSITGALMWWRRWNADRAEEGG